MDSFSFKYYIKGQIDTLRCLEEQANRKYLMYKKSKRFQKAASYWQGFAWSASCSRARLEIYLKQIERFENGEENQSDGSGTQPDGRH